MEVAGLVLGAIPVCILALEGWEAVEPRAKAFWRAPIAISRYVRDLRAHYDNLEVILKTMLHGCMDFEKIELEFRDILTEDWNQPNRVQLAKKLQLKHGDHFHLFQAAMQDICEDFKSIVALLGLSNGCGQMSNVQLDLLIKKQCSKPRSDSLGLQRRFRFTFKHKALGLAIASLSSNIDSLTSRLRNNEVWQKHKREERQQGTSEMVRRRRAHIQALARSIGQATVAARASSPLNFAILLESEVTKETHSLRAGRYSTAFHDRDRWNKAIFHVSDMQAEHSFDAPQDANSTTIDNIWSFIDTRAHLQQNIELHLDLRTLPQLTGPYSTRQGAHDSPPHSSAELISVRAMLGKPVSRASRLQTAATITSWIQLLYGTPFMTSCWAIDDIRCLDIDPIAIPLSRDRIWLHTELCQIPMSSPMQANVLQGTALLMLGILLIELYTNKACSALQGSTQLSAETLGNILNQLMATEAYDLPMNYARAVSDCWRLAHTPDAFHTDFGSLVDRVNQLAALL